MFAASSLDDSSVGRRGALAAAWFGRPLEAGGPAFPVRRSSHAAEHLLSLGYAPLAAHAVRFDVVEAILATVEPLSGGAPFPLPESLLEVTALDAHDVEGLLIALGYTATQEGFLAPAAAVFSEAALPTRPMSDNHRGSR